MKNGPNLRFKKIVTQLTGSIAFFPAIIAMAFLFVFWGMITLDDSATGKNIKAGWDWLRMKDAETARLVASTIAGGMLSFTVFSFSMVMIVLNQTASKMSNRILETIIRNRFQQIVLGFYIGTVIYSIFLVTAIRDTDSGIYVPVLSTYLLILFAIVDIFLFIYFLHFVTHYAKYQTIIHHIHSKTLQRLKHESKTKKKSKLQSFNLEQRIPSPKAGYFEGCDEQNILAISTQEIYLLEALRPIGSFVLKGTDLFCMKSNVAVDRNTLDEINESINVNTQPSFDYFLSGFNQLSEVAIKSLSPGINDPATAVLSIEAMIDLFCWMLTNPLPASVISKDGKNVISYNIPSNEEMFMTYLMPIWDYGREDRTIQQTMLDLIKQLLPKTDNDNSRNWMIQFLNDVNFQKSRHN